MLKTYVDLMFTTISLSFKYITVILSEKLSNIIGVSKK